MPSENMYSLYGDGHRGVGERGIVSFLFYQKSGRLRNDSIIMLLMVRLSLIFWLRDNQETTKTLRSVRHRSGPSGRTLSPAGA